MRAAVRWLVCGLCGWTAHTTVCWLVRSAPKILYPLGYYKAPNKFSTSTSTLLKSPGVINLSNWISYRQQAKNFYSFCSVPRRPLKMLTSWASNLTMAFASLVNNHWTVCKQHGVDERCGHSGLFCSISSIKHDIVPTSRYTATEV